MDINDFVPNFSNNARQNVDINFGFLSLMITRGIPQSYFMITIKKTFIYSEAFYIYLPGINKIFLLTFHITDITQLNPVALIVKFKI